MMFDMAFKELRRHKLRTILTIIGIAIGILLVTTLSSFSEGINSIIETEVSFLSGMITVVDEGTGWGNFLSSEIDESLGDEFLGIPGVDRVAGLILGNVPDVGPIYGGKPEDFDLFEIRLEDYIKDGRVMEAGEPEVMIGINYAKFSGYQTGDEITIRGKKYDVVGEMKTTGSEEDSGIITSLETAQEILKKEGIVSIIIVKPVSVSDARGIADEINRIYDSVDAGTDEDARREAAEFTGQTSATTWAMGSIAAVIAALGIMNVMFMSVRERRKEIGTMKALGATNYQVLLRDCFRSD